MMSITSSPAVFYLFRHKATVRQEYPPDRILTFSHQFLTDRRNVICQCRGTPAPAWPCCPSSSLQHSDVSNPQRTMTDTSQNQSESRRVSESDRHGRRCVRVPTVLPFLRTQTEGRQQQMHCAGLCRRIKSD